jgi:hypothetical protein
MIAAVPGVDNILGMTALTEIFPDYIPVSTGNLDFSRMSVKTREWLLVLESLLITAESATLTSTIPDTLRRIDRFGIMFISAVYENVNYMVAARQNYMYAGAVI